MRRGRLRRATMVGAALALLLLPSAAAAQAPEGLIGPGQSLLNNGRLLRPFGSLVTAGNFPTGGALTPDGRFYWAVSTGRGLNDVRIVDVETRKVVQTIPLPGASGGIAMDPARPRVFVSGVADSEHTGQQRPGVPGREGDVVHVFSYDPANGTATFDRLIGVPPPPGSPVPQGIVAIPGLPGPPQSFPPTNTDRIAWPDRLAVSPDGSRLLVPLNLADSAAIVDARTGAVRYAGVGHYPYGAAILRDGKTGLVSNETDGTVSVIDLVSGRKTKDVQVGAHLSHPEAIAVDPKADRAYVAVTNSDQIVVLDTKRMEVERTLSVGRQEGLGTAPVALSVTDDGDRLFVAEEGADEIAVFALPGGDAGDAGTEAAARSAARRVLAHEARLSAARAGGVAEDEEEEEHGRSRKAVRAQAGAGYTLIGRIPTAAFPTDVDTFGAACSEAVDDTGGGGAGGDEDDDGGDEGVPVGGVDTGRGAPIARAAQDERPCGTFVYLSGKGLGVGPNPTGPSPLDPRDNDDQINVFAYLPLIVTGAVGVSEMPGDDDVAAASPDATAQLRPANAQSPPAGTPLRPDGPIEHVFYVVRENRTYDQVLGDVAKGDGDPKLELFGPGVTPNMHALVDRFPLVDHVYANSEASIDGHFWTSAAKVSDYVNKNWFQNYAARGRPYDFGVYSVSFPPGGFLFDRAEADGISYFNYGEAIAGVVPVPDKDRGPAEAAALARKAARSDLGTGLPTGAGAVGGDAGCYPNDAAIETNPVTRNPVWDSSPTADAPPNAESRFDCFRQRFTAQLATNTVPAFNYLVLSNDHTVGTTPGKRTPKALVADNDLGLGQIVDLISHSPIWSKSVIFVIEDDSQDGADHVDAHRIPAAVISPYAKRGAVVHTRYDFLSLIRSMELILGMKPLGLFDQLATPMYDAFGPSPSNAEPYDAIVPSQSRTEENAADAPNAQRSKRLHLERTDAAPQRELDRILWQSVHGADSEPPPPGPNAVAGG